MKLIYILLMLSSLKVLAVHPEVKRVELENRQYTCRPLDIPVNCSTMESYITVRAAIDVTNCLSDIKNQRPLVAKDRIGCIEKSSTLSRFARSALIIDPSNECVIEHIKWCKFHNKRNFLDLDISEDETLQGCKNLFLYVETGK